MISVKELDMNRFEDSHETTARVIYPNSFEEGRRAGVERRKFELNPMAQNLGDLVSAKQSGMAKFLAEFAGLDENEVCDDLFGCEFSELSKTAAVFLIEHLGDRASVLKSRLRLAS